MTSSGYKSTEIGEIPEDWKLARLGDAQFSEINMGQSPPSASYNDRGRGIPFLQGNADFGFKFPEPTKYCTSPMKITKEGDILISVRAPVGDINISNGYYCIGRGLAAINPNRKLLGNYFLYYVLLSRRKELERLSTGSTFKAIGKNEIYNFLIQVPSLPEQQKISEILTTADRKIEHIDKEIKATKKLKKGLMQTLLTRGIGHTKFKTTEIGEIPEEWRIKRLREIAQTTSGGTPSRKNPDNFNGVIPWVKSGELNDNVISQTEEKINDSALQNSSAKMLPRGTLLIALYGATVGKTAILGISGTTNQAVCAILENDKIFDTLFLKFYLVYIRNSLVSQSSGGAQPNISQEIIRNTLIPLPSLSEQQKIAEILNTVDRKLELLRDKNGKAETGY